MFLSVKNTIFHSPLLQNATQTLTHPSPSPTTTGGRHEPPLLSVEPLHQEEHFNQSGILQILLKDSVEKILQSFISKLL
ncbi:hypothetical protein HKD37_16G045546 [Glycine soja]